MIRAHQTSLALAPKSARALNALANLGCAPRVEVTTKLRAGFAEPAAPPLDDLDLPHRDEAEPAHEQWPLSTQYSDTFNPLGRMDRPVAEPKGGRWRSHLELRFGAEIVAHPSVLEVARRVAEQRAPLALIQGPSLYLTFTAEDGAFRSRATAHAVGSYLTRVLLGAELVAVDTIYHSRVPANEPNTDPSEGPPPLRIVQ